MRKAPTYSLKRDGVTSSLLQAWLSCRRRAQLYLQGWTPIHIKDSLMFGSLFHDLLRMVYSHYREEKPPRGSRKLAADASKMAKPWFERYLRERSRQMASPKAIEELECAIAVCEAILPMYVHRWEEDFRKIEWIGLETEFSLNWGEVRLRGKRDGVYKKGKKGEVWVLETKTKSRVDEPGLMEQLIIDFQCQFYLLASTLELGGPPQGIDYNVVRRPSQRLGVKETFDDYAARIQADIVERPEHYFMRYEVAYASEDLAQFNRELSRILEDFRQWVAGDLPTYRNLSACVGRWNCAYLPACGSGTLVGYKRSGIFRELEASA